MNNRYLSAMPGFHYELALHLFFKKESSNHLATLSMRACSGFCVNTFSQKWPSRRSPNSIIKRLIAIRQ
ncbi:hypothetical protein GBR81_24135, partial [Escherichia coli]|nr:hypothetical protein [Escherichia coli]